jgi:hypothetical protein
MKPEINNLNPDVIFAKLTANMDEYTKNTFREFFDIAFKTKSVPNTKIDFWDVMRFFYQVFQLYYPSQSQYINNPNHHNIHWTARALFQTIPSDPEYKKIPRYLHGVLNHKNKTYRHPYDKNFIVKPERGKSVQFMQQVMQTYSVIYKIEGNPITDKPQQQNLLNELYSELIKLVQTSAVVRAPQRNVNQVLESGSMVLLNEYNIATSFDIVKTAAKERANVYNKAQNNIQESIKTYHKSYDTEYQKLLDRHDVELASQKTFENYQQALKRHRQEKWDFMRAQTIQKSTLCKNNHDTENAARKEMSLVKLIAQFRVARISRMR